MLWFAIVFRTMNADMSERRRAPHYFALTMVTLGVISLALSRHEYWGGLCIDSLNVANHKATWAEWLSCGPLTVLSCIIVVDKPTFSLIDWGITVALFVSLLAAFCIIFPQPYFSALMLLVVSCTAFVPVLFLPVYLRVRPDFHEMSPKISAYNFSILEEAHKMRYSLSVFLVLSFCLFPLVYLAAMWGFIDAASTVASFQMLSVVTKGLIAAACMDAHEGVLVKTVQALAEEQGANEARRSFMKYLFHEIRTPLNSISMGLELIEESRGLDLSERELVESMKQATLFMGDTLNDVFSVQQIEEGKLELHMVSFSFSTMLSRIMSTFQASLLSNRICLTFAICPFLQKSDAIGDRHRIEHVVSNLVSNAIKFSPDGGAVQIEVSCKLPIEVSQQCTKVPVTVAVTDQGCGISEEDQLKLFNNFVQVTTYLHS
jgi:signal transduction histidine kinase